MAVLGARLESAALSSARQALMALMRRIQSDGQRGGKGRNLAARWVSPFVASLQALGGSQRGYAA